MENTGFRITRDFINQKDKIIGKSVGEDVDGTGLRFQLRDDDDVLYFEGFALNEASLDDAWRWGMSMYGATRLTYEHPTRGEEVYP